MGGRALAHPAFLVGNRDNFFHIVPLSVNRDPYGRQPAPSEKTGTDRSARRCRRVEANRLPLSAASTALLRESMACLYTEYIYIEYRLYVYLLNNAARLPDSTAFPLSIHFICILFITSIHRIGPQCQAESVEQRTRLRIAKR